VQLKRQGGHLGGQRSNCWRNSRA